MAIQNRRGVYTDFDASKMVAGEFAVVQSGDPDSSNGVSLYVAFQSGTVKRIALIDDVNEIVGSLEDLETTVKTSIVDSINELSEKASIYHGVTSTSGATRDKVVVCSDFELKDGVYIAVDFSQNNTATNARLDVNNTGAKSIVASENSYVTDWIIRGSTYLFRFEDDALGGAYYLIGATERIPSDSSPIMDGTAASGTSKQYARADHVHPTDTSRASTATATTAANGLMSSTDKSKLDGIEAQANKTIIDATLTNTGQAADAKKVGDELTAVKEDLSELSTDGVVASAEQLLSDKYTIDQVPYHYRASGGNGADREIDEIVGGSVVWNSLARFNQSDIPSASNGITYAYTDGNSVLINGTATANETRTGWFGLTETAGIDFTRLNHKVLIYPKLISGTVEGSVSFVLPSNTSAILGTAKIGVLAYSNTNQIRVIHSITNGTVCTNAKITIICIDLTAKFGSAIADYLYTLDSATAGAGIAKLKSWGFPIDKYHEYNTGGMEHVSGISAHETVGFNQWDEEWEVGTINTEGNNANSTSNIRSKNYIPCLPNTSYYGNFPTVTGSSSLFFYDGDENFLSRTTFSQGFAFVTPESAKFMRFAMGSSYGTTYKNDICINLSDASKNGTYEPYEKHAYPLDSTLTLRGILKLDSNNQLYYDGDTYASDGTVTRKYGIVDLGTLPWWRMAESYQYGTFTATYSGMAYSTSVNTFICSKYEASNNNAISASSDNAIWNRSGSIVVKDSSKASMSAEDFKTAMSGVYLVYELATPTTEEAESYNEVQIVDDFGTEEYVTTSVVPVGHYTKYPENLRAKIEGLPTDFSTLIADTEKTATASKNYAVGDYLIYNNQLYKVTSAIASGATITVGTNVTATTIMAEIKALQ